MQFWEKQKLLIAFYEHETKCVCEKYGLTQIEFDIIMFLHNNPQYRTAADIVKIRRLTKSHVSVGVSLLESKGMLSRHCEDGNRKSVILTLTASANSLIRDGEIAQASFAGKIFDGFSNEEMQCCRELFSKMYDNASRALPKK